MGWLGFGWLENIEITPANGNEDGMGKRSEFERNPRDYYPTPYEAVIPLLKHLPYGSDFIEPCAGDGRLIKHLELNNHICIYACDIEPQAEGIEQRDVLFFNDSIPETEIKPEFIITNPPWEREVLHLMIDKFRMIAPTWLLFDSDWMFTGQARPYLKYCAKIVSVGRVSWMENGTSGMDNCAWYLFEEKSCQTVFVNN